MKRNRIPPSNHQLNPDGGFCYRPDLISSLKTSSLNYVFKMSIDQQAFYMIYIYYT